MSRIRSVHPGLFTDESFMAASVYARVLMIGLWTEADDHGVFEWKPLTLKARLLPIDSVDVSQLLHELEGLGVCRRYEEAGKAYGAVRNFRRFQRPQRPSYQHPFPENMRSYVGLSDAQHGANIAEAQPEHGNPPQMEDEGEGVEEEEVVDAVASTVVREPRATRMSPDWTPKPETRAKLEALGWTPAEIDDQAERTRDYWLAQGGARARKIDWERTFVNRMKDLHDHRKPKVQAARVRDSDRVNAAFDDHRRRIAAAERDGGDEHGPDPAWALPDAGAE